MIRLIRKPSLNIAHLIEKFVFIPAQKAVEDQSIAMPADCHFGLGFWFAGSSCGVVAGAANPTPYRVHVDGSTELLFVRFRPGLMPRIISGNAAQLLESSTHGLDQILSIHASDICEQLLRAPTPMAKQNIIENLLLPQSTRPLCQDKRCVQILGMIDTQDGRLTVRQVAEEFGISARSLHRMFLNQVGMSPKQVLRNVRLQRTVEILRTGSGFATLADLAHRCGFADQAHLNKEFQVLALQPPSAFLPRRAQLQDRMT